MDHQPSSPIICNTLKPSTFSTKKQRSTPSTYKGIVPQPNGRWGAQFYEGQKRVWVGTFDTPDLAARAYDMAVIQFRGHQTLTNLAMHHYTIDHLEFLASLSKEQVIEALRTHTFEDELARFTRVRVDGSSDPNNRELLFEKVVTCSDIGKLHRLVVPTKFARKYFPVVGCEDKGGVMVCFEDGRKGKMWRFKYCYWPSSQNYVLTKGWGEFVKDRGLRSGDVVRFYGSVAGDEKRFYIDTCSRGSKKEKCTPTLSDDGGGVDDELVRFKKLRLFGVDMCS